MTDRRLSIEVLAVEVQKLTYKEYWGYYWRITARHRIPGIFKWDQDLVELIETQCSLPPGGKILDLGCAGGDQSKLFSQKGYSVTGIDQVPSLIAFAKETYQQGGLHGQFIVGDMREIDYQAQFDLCVMLSGTFGSPSDDQDRLLLRKIHRSLKHNGHAFIDYLPLEAYCQRQRSRTWHGIEGGYALGEEWFDARTSTYRTRHLHILLEGRIIEAADEDGYGANEIIRCYGAREIELMAEAADFKVKSHLSRKQIGEQHTEPAEGEPRGLLVLQK